MKVRSAASGRERWRYDAAAILSVLLLAAYYAIAVIWRRAQLDVGVPSYDLHAMFFPNTLYALRSLEQGHGLFWNTLQNCGQPFFADPQAAVLYPLFAILAFTNIDVGAIVLVILHLALGGIAAYYLCIQLGLTPIAALCGALTFELGGNALQLASWLPILSAAYAWMPLAILLCERVLQGRSQRAAVCLVLVLTIQLLAGFPQLSFLTYQFIALRALWALACGEMARPARTLVTLASALILAPFLAAVHLWPAIGFARESLRSGSLTPQEIDVLWTTWDGYRQQVGTRQLGAGTTFTLIPAALAGLALLRSDKKRAASFYVLATALYVALAFHNPISTLYQRLPLGSMFRGLDRFLWVVGFSFSVVVAFGADALARTVATGRASRLRVLGALVAGSTGFYLLSASGLRAWEWALLGATAIACLAAVQPTRIGSMAYRSLPVVALVNLLAFAGTPFLMNLKDARSVFYRHRNAFEFVARRLTPADRMYHLGKHGDFSLMPKAGSLFGVPAVGDYQVMTSRRFAEFYVKLLYGPGPNVWMDNIGQFYYQGIRLPRHRALLNLAAARYVVVDSAIDDADRAFRSKLRLLEEVGSVRIYENPEALPRAFYVPRIAVIRNQRTLLNRFSHPFHNPRVQALVEELPTDHFTGSARGTGNAAIVEDRSETLVIDVRATSEGFLFLADQYYPGWEATVNGAATPILRANYAFRLVRIPAGESRVVFRYRPRELRAGMAVSLLTLCGLVVFVAVQSARVRARKRHQADRHVERSRGIG